MHRLTIISSLLTFLLFGCEQAPPQQPEQTVPKSTLGQAKTETGTGLFHQPIQPQLIELPNEALAYWRTDVKEKPALVLFSLDPLLQPIDAGLQEQANQLVLTGTAEQVRRHGSFNTAEPLILPISTVAAALDSGFFTKIYWIFPSKVGPEQLELAKFRNQMQEQNILTADEINSIDLNNGIYTGQVRGVPFEAIHYQNLHDISEPLVLHIDMSFFRGLYADEIKTPLYSLLRDTVDSIHNLKWQPLATTLSYSTIEGAIALDVRFVIANLAELMQSPQLLTTDMPKDWQLRSDALYAADMYSKTKKKELSKQLVQVAPDSAAAHYDSFQVLLTEQKLDPAFQALAQAAELDPGYGAAYLQLAQIAARDGNIVKALELLTLAEQLFPEYPFIPLQRAHLLAETGQFSEAEKTLAKLPQKWSEVYHQDIPMVIAKLRRRIIDGRDTSQSKER